MKEHLETHGASRCPIRWLCGKYLSVSFFPAEYKDIGIEKKKLNLLHCGQVLDDKATLLSVCRAPSLFGSTKCITCLRVVFSLCFAMYCLSYVPAHRPSMLLYLGFRLWPPPHRQPDDAAPHAPVPFR